MASGAGEWKVYARTSWAASSSASDVPPSASDAAPSADVEWRWPDRDVAPADEWRWDDSDWDAVPPVDEWRWGAGASGRIHGRSLHELRAEVCQIFSDAAMAAPSAQEAERENADLASQLERAKEELADKTVEEEWQAEVGFWHTEVTNLRKELEQQRRLQTEAAVEAREQALRSRQAQEILREEVKAEELALREVLRVSAELDRKHAVQQAQGETAVEEARRSNASLRCSLEQQAVLGPAGSGTANLFAAALPALEADSIEWIRDVLDEKLQQMHHARSWQ